VTDALRLVAGTLAIIPVPAPTRVDARVAGVAMALAPAVGGLLGLGGALVLWASSPVIGSWLGGLLAVTAIAALTRLIHWDGLADLADGLGSGRPPEGALEIMRRGDTGPFGVFAVVVVLGLEVGALQSLPPAALVAAVVLGRWALPVACRQGVPAAREEGLGAAVGGSVTWPVLIASVLGTGLLVAAPVIAGGLDGWAVGAAWSAVAVWTIAATAYVTRRLGGITGDALGALTETSTALALLVLTALS
jgi:adenosylcobinamide-GDP ribazoletransferase